MKSEIRSIRIVHKFGAFGSRNAFGRWIYGKRPDGITVACKSKRTMDGRITIWSRLKSKTPEAQHYLICETDFTKVEWDEIMSLPGDEQADRSNKIIQRRSHG